MTLLSHKAIHDLAVKIRPIVQPIIERNRVLTFDDIQNALAQIGRPSIRSGRTHQMIIDIICEG